MLNISWVFCKTRARKIVGNWCGRVQFSNSISVIRNAKTVEKYQTHKMWGKKEHKCSKEYAYYSLLD